MKLEVGEDGLPFVPLEAFMRLPLTEIDAIRRSARVIRVDPRRLVVMRSSDVAALSADPRLIQVPGGPYCDAMNIPEGYVRNFLETFMLMTNGADHSHRRGAFVRTFAHPVIRKKRDRVRAVADRIIADLPRGETFNFLDLCASRLPAEMIAEVLGLPTEDSHWFARHVYSLSRCLMAPYDAHEEVEESAEALHHFVAKALEARRKDPRDDLLSMLATDDTERGLAPEELIYQVIGVILGGSDTTRTGFNMVVGRLLGERAIWDEVMADRSLIPDAIDEALRIEPPVGSMPRYTPAPVQLDDITMPAGQLVSLSTTSALRDDAQHAKAETFDLHRKDRLRPHMVFGGGAHRCLGEMLARLELEEGLAALMDGAPDIELVEAPKMLSVGGIRRSTPLIARIP